MGVSSVSINKKHKRIDENISPRAIHRLWSSPESLLIE